MGPPTVPRPLLCIFNAIFCINAVEVVRDLFAAVRNFSILNNDVLFHQLHQPMAKMEMNCNLKQLSIFQVVLVYFREVVKN